MELLDIKRELESFLGHSVNEALFLKCLEAYPRARHGPVGLGGFAKMGYYSSFKRAVGEGFEDRIFNFFFGQNEYSESIRRKLIPYRFNIELMPKMLDQAYRETYGNEPYNAFCESWYERFIWYYLKAGIPEDGVAGLIRKHRIPVELVKRYGRTSGLIPETVAQNILNHRHAPQEYDSLAKPRIRVTRKMIAGFRRKLEEELRRIWTHPPSLEETVREECNESKDEDIARMLSRGVTAEGWANTLNDL